MTAAAPEARTLDISGTPHIPFTRLLKVELRKSYDTRAGFWLLLTIGILVLAAEAIVLAIVVVQDEPAAFGDFIGVAAFVTSILLPVLGIMLVTSEWSQRTAMVSFALDPRRHRIILAKMIVGLVLTLVTALAATALGAVCNLLYIALDGDGSWEFGWNFFFGFLITQFLAMLGGFALATLLLNTPAAIVVFFVYKWVLPGLFALGAALMDWFGDLRPWIDFQLAQGPVFDLTIDTGEEWGNLLVSGAVWLAIPLVVGMWRILHAEVK